MLIIYHKLRGQGYQCFLAGGCVRDALLGKIANDLDLASDAAPEVIEQTFSHTVNVGKAFGVIRVLIEQSDIEVTRFRQDGVYGKDQRRPHQVYFSTAKEDAERRDFTMNALFYDLESNSIIDYVNGIQDINAQVIRTVGDPDLRFQEDALRMLRAVRFSATLNFAIESVTLNAIQKNKAAIHKISKERMIQELEKMICGKYFTERFNDFIESGLLMEIFPEFQIENLQFDFLQKMKTSKHHYDLDLYFIYFLQATFRHASVIINTLESWPFSQKRRQWGKLYLQVKSNPEFELRKIFVQQIELLFHPVLSWLLCEFQYLKIEIDLVHQLLQIREFYQGEQPIPLVQAADLKDRFQGQKLGQALKLCYQIQILNRLTSTKEIISEFLCRNPES